MLNLIRHEGGSGTPLLIAHGLFGSARNWSGFARRMTPERMVIVADMRNHGDSPRAATQTYTDMADDLAQVLAINPGVLMGHSMGGKAAMVLALRQPELVPALIVADIAPIAYTHSHRATLAAMRAVPPDVASRAAADRIMATHLDDVATRAFLLQSLDLAGHRWKLNLDVLEAAHDAIIGWPDIPGRYDGPVLFLRGSLSDYMPASAEAVIRAKFPKAQIDTIPNAGHWLHADQPAATAEAIRNFLHSSLS